VVRVFPNEEAVTSFLVWLTRHQLGRKRLLDTLLAATYQAAGVKRVITNNERDFKVFEGVEITGFR